MTHAASKGMSTPSVVVRGPDVLAATRHCGTRAPRPRRGPRRPGRPPPAARRRRPRRRPDGAGRGRTAGAAVDAARPASQAPEQGPGPRRQDHGADDEHPGGGQGRVEALGQGHGALHPAGQVLGDDDPVRPVDLPGDIRQVLHVHGPRGVDGDDDDRVGDRLEDRQDALGVLVRHDADDGDQVAEAEDLLHGAHQRGHAVRVVPGVDEHGGAGAQDLQAPGAGDRGEAVLDDLGRQGPPPEDGLDGGQRQQGASSDAEVKKIVEGFRTQLKAAGIDEFRALLEAKYKENPGTILFY